MVRKQQILSQGLDKYQIKASGNYNTENIRVIQ